MIRKIVRHIILIVFICFIGFSSSYSQNAMYSNTTNKGFNANLKPKLSVSLSTTFNSYGYGMNMMSTSVLPSVSLPVSKKFSLRATVGYSSLFMNYGNGTLLNSEPTSYGHISVSGDYLLTSKITLRATAYKTFRIGQPQTNIETDSPYLDFSSKGVIIDAEYKVTDNFRINVGFEYREQNYPFYGPGINPMNPGIRNSGSIFDINHNNGLNPF